MLRAPWMCLDENCDLCEHDLPEARICDAVFGGHYCCGHCFLQGRERIKKRVQQIAIKYGSEK